jgi:uncharacterized protein (TIGR00369 family)
MAMDREAFFWKIMDGKVPPPPIATTLGLVFKHVDAGAGTIEVEFTAKPEFANPAGNVQGGILGAMLDDAMGTALAATLAKGEFAPTLNLSIAFERPAKPGSIQGKGRVLKRGKDVCFLAGELFQNGERVASATATALVRRLQDRSSPL